MGNNKVVSLRSQSEVEDPLTGMLRETIASMVWIVLKPDAIIGAAEDTGSAASAAIRMTE